MSLLLSSVSYELNTYSNLNDMTLPRMINFNSNVICSNTGGIDAYGGVTIVSKEDIVFKKFVEDIVSNSESMPSDFAALVNDNFWDLI